MGLFDDILDIITVVGDPASVFGIGATDILGHLTGDPDANRSFHILLYNDTPFNLVLIDSKDVTGEWDSEKRPPKSIGPMGTSEYFAEIKMKSSGYKEGVDGYIQYQIQDKKGFFDPDSHSGNEGCFKIHWNNPFYGYPTADKSFEACPDVLGSKDSSSDYQLKLRQTLESESESWTEWPPFFTDPINWIKFMKGFVANPRIEVSLQTKTIPSVSALTKIPFSPGGFEAEFLPKPRPLKIIPVNGGMTKSWIGKWTTALANEQSHIHLMIEKGSLVDSTNAIESNIFIDKYNIAIKTYEQSYRIDLNDTFSSIDMHKEDVIVYPSIMPPYKGDILKKDDGRIIHSMIDSPSLPFSWTKLISSTLENKSRKYTPAIEVKVNDDGNMVITGVKVDTMTLSNNIYLQLFKNIDPFNYFAGFRIRYLRTTDDGKPLEDIMLREYNPIK